jgi:Uma2 family endonuclease
MSAGPPSTLSPAEYLALDRGAETRHEYVDGLMVAMSGGTARHAVLIAEVARHLGNALSNSPCAVSVTELRLQVQQGAAYLFPDIMVLCGAIEYATGPKDTITNPTVVVEVLSGSTERWDRVGKFARYRQIPSLREYLLVSQDELCIEWYTRRDDGDWAYHAALGPEGLCRLASLGIDLPLADIYRKIDLTGSPLP